MDKTTELKIQINNYIFEMLEKEEFKKGLSSFLYEELLELAALKKDLLLHTEFYKSFKQGIKNNLCLSLQSPNTIRLIEDFIANNIEALEKSNKSLDSFIPPVVTNSIKVYIYNHKDDLINSIKKLLNSKDVEKRLLAEISNAVGSMNPMVARFINVNNIFIKLKSSIEDYLNDSKNIMEIINYVNKQLDGFMKKKLSEFTSYFPQEGRKAIVKSLTNTIAASLLSEEFIDKFIAILEDKLAVELSKLNKETPKLTLIIDSTIACFMDYSYNALLENETLKEAVKALSKGIVDNLLSKPLIDLL